MAGEPPGRGAVQTGSGEGVKAQLSAAGVDILGNGLQGSEVLDLLQGVTGLLQELGVDDDAEGLVAVADGLQLASLIVEVEVVGGQLLGDGAVRQVQGVVVPVFQAGQVADVVDGGSFGLGHLSGEGVGVGAGSSGDNLHGNAGLLGVELGQLLQGGVCLRLEVQVVNPTGAFRGGGFVAAALGGVVGACGGVCGRVGVTGRQAQNHNQRQQQCD